jgi:Zn-dependent M28 family amino/carboxypeptidase
MRFGSIILTTAVLTGGILIRQQDLIPAGVRAAADGIVAANLQRDVEYLAADALRGRATPSPGLDTAAAYITRRLAQLGLEPAGDAGTYQQRYSIRGGARAYNIVARLPGGDPTLKTEAVTIAAHLDGAVDTHAINGDSIYNAADDNASGSAGLLATAEAFTRAPRPRRSLVFIWDTGEETGLLGTRHFVSRPVVPIANIITHINVDMIGRTRQPGNVQGEELLSAANEVFVVGPRVLSTELDSLIEQGNRAYLKLNLNHRFDLAEHEYFYPRTDAAPYLERGIPIVDFFTGEHPDYHLPSDEASKIDTRKLEQVSRTVFVTAWLLADRTQRPTLDKGIPAHVRRVRD